MWSGDDFYLSGEVPEWMGVVPREGTFFGAATNIIPKGSQHPATAHLFFNYMFRTEVNALLIDVIGKVPAHKHVMEFMSDKMKAWPSFNVDPEWVKKCDTFEEKAYTGKGKELRLKIWEDLKK
jgi:spermidine/putrescine-binding protein